MKEMLLGMSIWLGRKLDLDCRTPVSAADYGESSHIPSDDAVCSPKTKHRVRGMRGSGVLHLAHGRSCGRQRHVPNTFLILIPV
jgi:hypothetical protein